MPDTLRVADWVVHGLVTAWFLWAVVVSTARWLWPGRVPTWMRAMPASFERWSNGETSEAEGPPTAGLVVTRGFWVALCCWTVWLVVSLAV